MKIKDKQKIIGFAINQYNERLKGHYQRTPLSKKRLLDLVEKYKHPGAAVWCYCCNGLYEDCWEDLFAEGIWGQSQEDVNDLIKWWIQELSKSCKRDNRTAWYEDEYGVHVVIVARDLPKWKKDFLFLFTDEVGLL